MSRAAGARVVRPGGLLAAMLACACATVPPDQATGAGPAGEPLVMPPALPARAMAVPVIAVPEAAASAGPAETPLPVAATPPAPATVATPAAPVTRVAVATPVEAPPPVVVPAPASAPEPPAVPPAAAPVAAAAPVIQAAVAAPAPIPEPVATPRAAGPRDAPRVQLVAAGSEAEARAHWGSFAQRLPDLAEGRVPHVLAVERPGQAPIWRLRVGGFADAAEARAWCERLRARGGNCWVSG